MITKIFTVYDSKAEAYLPPFYMQSKGQAVRAFQDSASDPQHQFFRHSGDYTLFELGEFDDQTASFQMLHTMVNLGTALEHKKSGAQQQMPLFEAKAGA